MNFADAKLTNLLLVVLTLVSLAQMAIVLMVILRLRAAVDQTKATLSNLMGSDIHEMHARFTHLLKNVEMLVARGNNVLGAVERGAHDLGAAASLAGQQAQRALALGSSEVHAVTTAVKTSVSLLKQIFARRPSRNGQAEPTPVVRFGTHRNVAP